MNNKFFLFLMLFIVTLSNSCINETKNYNDLLFLKKIGLNVEEIGLVIVLPNEACSFCVNNIIQYLENNYSKGDTAKIELIFLESDIITFIDKKRLNELERNYKIHYMNADWAMENYIFEDSNSKPEIISIEKSKNHINKKLYSPDDDFTVLFKLIDKYYSKS